jgi:hypothetical protein
MIERLKPPTQPVTPAQLPTLILRSSVAPISVVILPTVTSRLDDVTFNTRPISALPESKRSLVMQWDWREFLIAVPRPIRRVCIRVYRNRRAKSDIGLTGSGPAVFQPYRRPLQGGHFNGSNGSSWPDYSRIVLEIAAIGDTRLVSAVKLAKVIHTGHSRTSAIRQGNPSSVRVQMKSPVRVAGLPIAQ